MEQLEKDSIKITKQFYLQKKDKFLNKYQRMTGFIKKGKGEVFLKP